jgi:hypothetical protein
VDFSVITIGVAPVKILIGCLVQVHFDMLESVLLDVTNSQIGMLLDTTSGRDRLACEELNQGGFPCSVTSDDGSSGR